MGWLHPYTQTLISPPYLLTLAAVSFVSAIAMSVTTTSNPLTGRTLEILGDYELHHSKESQESASTPSQASIPDPRADTATERENPPDWPKDHRRIPPRRSIDRGLDYEQRPAGLNGGEYVFIQTMLQGVRLNANVARWWRSTGGRINDRIFRYDIGGEW